MPSPLQPACCWRWFKDHRELRGEDSPASEGRKPAKGAPVIYRWNQDCARSACCSVGLGSPHRPLQSHSHRLSAVGLKSSAGLIFGRGGQGGRPPGLPWSSSGGLKSPHFYGTGLCLCWASSQLQGAAGGTPAPEDCSVQLDCAHGCSQCPQKVEECRENISDNGSFVLKKGKERDSQWRASTHGQARVCGTRISGVSTKGDESWYLLPGWAKTPPHAAVSPQVPGQPLPTGVYRSRVSTSLCICQ